MVSDSGKLRILFLCTGNSCRSQMAEAWTRRLKGDLIDAYSAGVSPAGVFPETIDVMKEVGIDISDAESNHVNDFADVDFDNVVTLCGNARENCPNFPGKTKVTHVGFEDPPWLARNARTKEEVLVHYRRIRDEIRDFVETLPDTLNGMQDKREEENG